MSMDDILNGGIPKGKIVVIGGSGGGISTIAALMASGTKMVAVDMETHLTPGDHTLEQTATFDYDKYHEYQRDLVRFARDHLGFINPTKVLLVDDSHAAKLRADWDKAAQEDFVNGVYPASFGEVVPEQPPEDLPKRNLNGKRMANQPLDRRQNYLTLRNKRW